MSTSDKNWLLYNDEVAHRLTSAACNELSAQWMDQARCAGEPEHCDFLYYRRHQANCILCAFYKDRRNGRIRTFVVKLETGLKLTEATLS